MTKSELFKRMWIPVRKRLPLEDPTKWVLVWNYAWKEPLLLRSDLAYYGGRAMLRNEPVSQDRIYSHWVEVVEP